MDLVYKAKDVYWLPLVLRGTRGYFSDVRIDRGSIPIGFSLWELADDGDGVPCRYRQGIMINFYGSFITKENLPVDDSEWLHGYIDSEEECYFGAGYSMRLEQIIEIEEGENNEDVWLCQNFDQ